MIYVFAVLYGYLEQQLLLGDCCNTGERVILGQFSVYHLVMGIMFVYIINLGRGKAYNLPLMLLLQDISFFIFRQDWPDENSWVTWNIGGFEIAGVFIPFIYLILILIFFLWRWINARFLGRHTGKHWFKKH